VQLEDWQKSGATFAYHGHDVFYRREGRGETLVLIHGFPTASWDWYRIWPTLAERFDVVAPDMLGFGFSAKPTDYDYSVMDQATLHEVLLESLGVTRVHILAHDYGDTVAQELLARFAQRRTVGTRGIEIQSTCLLNGGIFPGVHRPLMVQRLLMSPLGPLLARCMSRRTLRNSFDKIFGPDTRPTDDELDDFWALIEHNGGRRIAHKMIRFMAEREVHRERWVGTITDPQVPVRLIDGVLDPISGARLVAHYRQVVSDPDVVELENVGHYPQIEAPETTLAAFLEFVAR
jgi:pimeloyl-ACP methyl ester carboxylesterase